MAASTTIEWAANRDGTPGATWNPIRARDRETGKIGTHCVHASEGCRHCYAETFNLRGLPGAGTGLAAAQYLHRRKAPDPALFPELSIGATDAPRPHDD